MSNENGKDTLLIEFEQTTRGVLRIDYDEVDKFLGDFQTLIDDEGEQHEMFRHIVYNYLQGERDFIDGIGKLTETSIDIDVDLDEPDINIVSEDIENSWD